MNMFPSRQFKKNPPFWRRLDVPFVIMGLLFVAMAVSEYLFPVSSEGTRIAVKIISGTQAVFAFAIVLLTPRSGIFLFRRLPLSFILLCFWLCVSGIIYTAALIDSLYLWSMYLYWLSLFLFFYIRSRAHPEGVQMFIVLAVCSLFVWLPALIKSTSVMIDIRNIPSQYKTQNYIGYYIIAMFPYALLLKKKSLKIIAIAMISFGAIYSLKRGAVLALVLMALSSSVLYVFVISSKKKKAKRIIAVISLWAIAIASGGFYAHSNMETIDRRINTDSRRSLIYTSMFDTIEKANFYEFVVGHGDRQAKKTTGYDPHNDWLLLLYDYGIVSVVLMLNVYISLFALLWKLCKVKSMLSLPLISTIMLMACVQFYSIGLYLKTFGFITGSIGLTLGSFCNEVGLRKYFMEK